MGDCKCLCLFLLTTQSIACKAVALFFGGLLIKIIKNTGGNGGEKNGEGIFRHFFLRHFSPVFFIILINNPPKNKATALQATQPKTPKTCCKLSILPTFCINLSFADLLQLVGTSCNTPVEIINLQQVCYKISTDLLQLARFWLCTSRQD